MTEPLPTYTTYNPDDYINLLLQRIDTMCDMIDQLRQERTMLLLQRDEMLKRIGEEDKYEDKIFNLINEYKKIFPEDFKKSYPFQLGGYVLKRKDGFIWGDPTGSAYYLFCTKIEAEATLRAIDADDSWEIKHYGL